VVEVYSNTRRFGISYEVYKTVIVKTAVLPIVLPHSYGGADTAFSENRSASTLKVEEFRLGSGLYPFSLGLMTTIVTCIYNQACSSTLKMEVACSSETSISVHKNTRFQNPEDLILTFDNCCYCHFLLYAVNRSQNCVNFNFMFFSSR
jgi:hypothetical protein